MKKIVFNISFVVILVVIIFFVYYFVQISLPNGSNDEEVLFTISAGQSVDQIGDALKNENFLRNKFVFKLYLYLTGKGDNLQAGSYLLSEKMSMTELTDMLISGKTDTNEQWLTVIEGYTSTQIAEYLSSLGIVTTDEFLELAEFSDTRDFLPDNYYEFLIDKPDTQGIEGFLFPDSYLVFADVTVEEIVEKMLDNFDNKLTVELRDEIKSQGKTIYEIVTLASVIEKEARKSEDRKILAGLFYNRLEVDMALQSDATVNYITGKKTTRPSLDDISIDNLYNTYEYPGLPPGPICNPSLDSIQAAIYPIDNDYVYYISAPDGTSDFSHTYEQHLEKKDKYYN